MVVVCLLYFGNFYAMETIPLSTVSSVMSDEEIDQVSDSKSIRNSIPDSFSPLSVSDRSEEEFGDELLQVFVRVDIGKKEAFEQKMQRRNWQVHQIKAWPKTDLAKQSNAQKTGESIIIVCMSNTEESLEAIKKDVEAVLTVQTSEVMQLRQAETKMRLSAIKMGYQKLKALYNMQEWKEIGAMVIGAGLTFGLFCLGAGILNAAY